MAFATQFYKYPNFDLVLTAMIQNGARYSCLDRPQTCPLLRLSQSKTKDPIALIKIFYECKPHVSEEHLKQCLSTAVKNGSLPIICALLQLDHAAVSSTEIVAKLAENRVQWDLAELIRNGHAELGIFLAAAAGWEFVPKTVVFAIRQNFLSVAQNMIESRIVPPQTRLSVQDSNSIWDQLSLQNFEHVQTALTLGVAPTPQCFRQVVGNIETMYNARIIRLWNYEHLETNVDLDESSTFQKIDLFVGLDVPIDSLIISNAAGSGNLRVLEYVLRLWVVREDYRDVCIVRPLAVHHAFMQRNWDMVQTLIDAATVWHEQNSAGYTEGSPLFTKPTVANEENNGNEDDGDGEGSESDASNNEGGVDDEYWPNLPAPYPLHHDDSFFYENLPRLVSLGVYGEKIYDKVLAEMAYHSYRWSLEEVAFSCEKLQSMGAIVSSGCLQSASYDGDSWNEMTTRFPYFLDKFEFDPKRQPTVEDDGFFILDESASGIIYHDTTPVITMVLAKGIRPCVDALYSSFRSRSYDTELRDAIKSIFANAEPGSDAHSRFFENLVKVRLRGDFDQEETERLADLLKFMKGLGFSCSQELLDEVAVEREWPNLARMMLPFVFVTE
ncbi:hypothetical protein BDR26DRAFT_864233 [Obelidium mucronatum]|nr:hypothetical protein BDR26DRAFT_864233 [Obelidium mucronatum]